MLRAIIGGQPIFQSESRFCEYLGFYVCCLVFLFVCSFDLCFCLFALFYRQ